MLMNIGLLLAFIGNPAVTTLGLLLLSISLLFLIVGILLIAQSCLRESNWQRKPSGHFSHFSLGGQYPIQAPGMAGIGVRLLHLAFMGLSVLCSFTLPFWLNMLIWIALTALSLVGFIVCEQKMHRIFLTSELPSPENTDLRYLKIEYLAELTNSFVIFYSLFPLLSVIERGLRSTMDSHIQMILLFILVICSPAFLFWFYLTWLHRRLVSQWYLERQHRPGTARDTGANQQPLPASLSRRALFGLMGGGIALWMGGSWWLWSRYQALMPVEEEQIYPPSLTSDDLLNSAYWSQDLHYLATGNSTRVHFWDQEKKQLLHILDLPLPLYRSSMLYDGKPWSPNNRYFYCLLASSQYGATLIVFDPFTGKQLSQLLQDVVIEYIVWSPDSERLAAATMEFPDHKLTRKLYIWEASSGMLLQQTVMPDTQENISSMAWSPDNQHIALTIGSNLIRFWDVQANKLSKDVTNYSFGMDTGERVTWSPDGWYLAFQSRNSSQQITIMSHAQPSQTFTIAAPTLSIDQVMAWSPDGHYVAVSSSDGLAVWSLAEQKPIRSFFDEAWASSAQELYWSRDGFIISINMDGLRQVWRWS